MKNRKIIVLALSVILLLTVGCVKYNDNTTDTNETQLVYCSECGEASTKITKYCPKCGKETTWSSEKVDIKKNQQDENDLSNTSENTKDKKETTQSIKTENKVEHIATNETHNHSTNLNHKDEYINKLNKIEESMSDLDYLYEGSTIDMRRAESEKYTRWDNMLNEVYSLIKKELSPSDAENLKQKEVSWIKYRDKKAENDSSECKGGTMESVRYMSSLGQSTKERCYELVDTYMK